MEGELAQRERFCVRPPTQLVLGNALKNPLGCFCFLIQFHENCVNDGQDSSSSHGVRTLVRDSIYKKPPHNRQCVILNPRLSRVKNLSLAIQAIPTLRSFGKPPRLAEGPQPRLRERATTRD